MSAEIYLRSKKGSKEASLKQEVVTLGFENSSLYLKNRGKNVHIGVENADDDDTSYDNDESLTQKEVEEIDIDATSDNG